MTVVQTLFGDPPATQSERLHTQLAAVALLVARTDRDVAQDDILLATVFEILEREPLTASQIRARVEQAWPRLQLSEQQLATSLEAAVRIDHVRELPAERTRPIRFELLDEGRRCLIESQEHAADSIDRFRSQISDELRDRVLYRDASDTDGVVAMVLTALRAAVADAIRPDTGSEIARLGAGLHLVGASLDAIDEIVNERVSDSERADLVKSLTTMALDHSRELGNEIVHRLIVGHLLYVFMTRPDKVKAATDAGALSGEKLILDTPVLVAMLGPPRTSEPVRNLIAVARQVGVEVVLFERTVEELQHTLANTGTHEAAALERTIQQGADPRVLAQLQRQERLLWGWLHWISTDRPFASWDEWRAGPRGDHAMLSLLVALGVEPREPESFDGDFELSARCAAFEEELRARIDTHGARKRSHTVLRHDALNLTSLLRARRSNPSSESKAWPGAFLLTTDSHVNDVYTIIAGHETYPAALTFSQCAQLIAAYSTPRASEGLAFDLAHEVAEEILLSRATTVPLNVATELAEALRTEPVRHGDVEQLTFEIYRTMANDRGALGTEDRQRELAGQLAHRLRTRREDRDSEERKARDDEKRRSELAEARRAERLTAQAAETEKYRQDATEKGDQLAKREEADRVRDRQRRAELVVFAAALASVFLLARGFVVPALVGLVACLIGVVEGRRWARDTAGLTTFALAFLYGGFTLWPAIQWAINEL